VGKAGRERRITYLQWGRGLAGARIGESIEARKDAAGAAVERGAVAESKRLLNAHERRDPLF
jgi:hypothetical protein